MADPSNKNDELELDSEGNAGAVNQSPSVRKNISLKLKGKSRGSRGRRVSRGSRKGAGRGGKAEQEREEEVDDDKMQDEDSEVLSGKTHSLAIEEESCAISKLESPCSLTSLERTFTEPLHHSKQLKWNHKVNLIGEKLLNPMIHCCEDCSLPILIYGRMIPCKHVFCLDCAKKSNTKCPRCQNEVTRVEPSSLGTVFVCMHGAARHSTGGCRRTYLSQRDLQAHINHRHERQSRSEVNTGSSTSASASDATSNSVPPPPPQAPPPLTARDPRGPHLTHEGPSHTPPHSHPPINSHPPPPHPLPTPHLSEYRQEERALLTSVAPPSLQAPPSSRQTTHLYSHPPPSTPTHTHTSYPSPIPVVSTRSNLITVPIHDDSSSSPHLHAPPPQSHLSTYASQSPGHPAALPPQHPTVSAYTAPPPPPTHHYPPSHTSQPPPYSQPQSFNPPTHIPPPAIHNPNPPPPLFSGPPPPVHHAPPPVSYNPPPIRQHNLPPPPQHFPGPTTYEDAPYPPSWGTSRPPPPGHAPLPPRPMGAPPSQPDPGYRPPPSYYP